MSEGECGSEYGGVCLSYNIYVTLSIVLYSTAHNHPGITTLQVRWYYKIKCYNVDFMSQKLKKMQWLKH